MWLPFSTNIVINLGSEDGPRDVGFAFVDATGYQFSFKRTVVLAARPNQAYVTAPLPETVTSPMIQIDGFFIQPILSIQCDLVNSNVLHSMRSKSISKVHS